MNRRINKTMALQAAERMADKAFAENLDASTNAINKEIENLARKYVPQEVIDICKKYSEFFSSTTNVSVSAYKDTVSGSYRENWITGKICFGVPYEVQSITVTPEEYAKVKELVSLKKRVKDSKDKFQNEVYLALLQLNTEKNVKDNLPEALKYIEFPPEKQVPACKFDDLNKAISRIRKD